MNRMIRPVIILLLLAPWTFRAAAQETMPAIVSKDLDQYQQQRLQEKLFVHTDKEFYLAGEICWYKLYYVDASFHHPLDLSKVAYLEWLDKDNKPVLQAKIGLTKGQGDGSLYLPMTLRSGNYKLRAYTNWMKNFGADWFFEKTITIVNARKSAETPLVEIPLKYTVTFFPEGGNLVENIPGKVAFKITDQYGKGVDCRGTVAEDDQDTILSFQSWKFGIGSFILTPRSGHRYRSTIRLPDGTAIPTLLPTAYKEGMVMNVTEEGDGYHIQVNIQSTTPGAGVYLVAHTRQSVKIAEAATLRDGKAGFRIDKNLLGDGISHLTLFNAAGQPVCERLVFKNPSRQLHMTLNTDKVSYEMRKQINLQVSAAGPDDKPLVADCSLSVFRLDSLQAIPEGHIGTYLWLASDLKGKIESPDYYFSHPEDRQAMDNLLITHGWRRFRWEEVLHPSAPTFDFPPEYHGALITGKIIDTRTNTPAKDIQGYVSVPGTRTQFSSVISDPAGMVKFELRDFYGGQEIIAQTDPTQDSMYRVDINNPFVESYTDKPISVFMLPAADSGLLQDKSEDIQVLNRYGGARLKQFRIPAGVDTSAFYYKADHSYLLDDFVRFTTVEEVMREYVVAMLVQRRGGHFQLALLDLPNNQFFDSNPLILLDGVPIFEPDKMIAVDPLKIRKLDMLHRRYFLGKTNYTGIMNWSTYKGDLADYVLDPHAAVIDYEGLQLQREFYSPTYATPEEAGSHLPDFRNVLYWTPRVPVKADGKGALNFYSSDIPGKYIAVVEGIAADGTAGSKVISFEVK